MNHLRDLNDLLYKKRMAMGKSRRELANEVGVSQNCLANWEKEVLHLPSESKLPLIAEHYQLTLQEVTEAYTLSKQARDSEKEFPKINKRFSDSKFKTEGDLLRGEIGSRKEIYRMNDRYGGRHH